MTNVTLAIDSQLLQKSREVALQKGSSVNEMIREYLKQITETDQSEWYQHYSAVAAKIQGDSKGWIFNREELYDR